MLIECACGNQFDPNDGAEQHPPQDPHGPSICSFECPECHEITDFHDFKLITKSQPHELFAGDVRKVEPDA
jgi:hypothetical protein